MKKIRTKIAIIIGVIILIAAYYYYAIPAINIHDQNLWMFILCIPIAAFIWLLIRPRKKKVQIKRSRQSLPNLNILSLIQQIRDRMTGDRRLHVLGILILAIFAAYFAGSLLSSPVLNASRYQKLMTVEQSEFTEDISQISYDQIPLLDRDSAQILGDRKMGSLVDLASQFEVSDLYSQINLSDQPVRVTPLQYAGLIKWFTNRKNGIPAYIKIDMATKKTELVRLDQGMKYTPSDHFNRNLYRHLRFHYPTYMFDDISFEIDEEGTPYWVCSVKKFNIGLFGGQTIGHVVLCNAVTGECTDYKTSDVPSWVDRVYSADLLVSLYDYYGTLKHGFINSILGQRNCLTTTNGYNFLAIDDDVWVYTGVTSITSDQSNVGFVLMNQRTMETKYYEIEGAIEDSAMSSAEGKVQNLGYQASFPLLLNIDSQPTYFMALKDASGLVKKYAMVNVRNYQIVATGDTVSETEESYVALMSDNGVKTEDEDADSKKNTATGTIVTLTEAVVEGNSHCYILLEGDDTIYDIPVSTNIDIIRYHVGDSITIEYTEGSTTATVSKIQR